MLMCVNLYFINMCKGYSYTFLTDSGYTYILNERMNFYVQAKVNQFRRLSIKPSGEKSCRWLSFGEIVLKFSPPREVQS